MIKILVDVRYLTGDNYMRKSTFVIEEPVLIEGVGLKEEVL